MNSKFVKALAASVFATFAMTGCIADSSTDLESDVDSDIAPEDSFETSDDAISAGTMLDRPSATKLRVAVWNTFAGSIFPKTDSLWQKINIAGEYDKTRTENAKGVLNAVEADVWLLQETAYWDGGNLPSGVTVTMINDRIRDYMNEITGDSWQVKCNGGGLCLMVRGNIQITKACTSKQRNNGYLLKLGDWANASLAVANVHYMNVNQANETATMMKNAKASAKIVAGDFNNKVGEDRFNAIAGVPTLKPVALRQVIDGGATHLTSAVKTGKFENTHGSTNLKKNVNGKAFVKSETGNRIDHFFFGSSGNTWAVHNELILNSLLLSKETLDNYKLNPLATALVPAKYTPYFSEFMLKGTIKPMPDSLDSAVKHDHLPFVVNLSFNAAKLPAITPAMDCP